MFLVEQQDLEAIIDIHNTWIQEDGNDPDDYTVGIQNGLVIANAVVDDEEVGGEKGDLMDLGGDQPEKEDKEEDLVKESVDIFVGEFA